MRTDDIIAGIVKGIWWTAGAIFAGEVTFRRGRRISLCITS
jgi:hypothetical protein